MLANLPPWAAVTLLTAVGGVLSALAAGLFLALPGAMRQRAIPHLLSYATGALLGAALAGLLPEAIEAMTAIRGAAAPHRVGLLLLGGVLLFFVLEKLVLWRHCHDPSHDPGHDHGIAFSPLPAVSGSGVLLEQTHEHGPDCGHAHYGHPLRRAKDGAPLSAGRARAAAMLALAGDTLHNFLDGVVIAVAWLSDPAVGIATAVAVFAHEIPQEVGDLGVLLHGGFSRARALWLNTLSSVAAVAGGLLGVFFLAGASSLLPDVMTIAAASLLYVAVADLIPGLHQRVDPRAAFTQLALMGAGLATVLMLGPAHS
jgi:zinc and cadmium transporter